MRTIEWTDLPGPSQFLEWVGQDLRESKSVLAVVPSCFDDRWVYVVRSSLENDYDWREAPASPAEFLQDISSRSDGHAFIHPREIFEANICRQGYVLKNPSIQSWMEWAPFLQCFAELNRAVDELNRNVFLVTSVDSRHKLPNELLLSERCIEGFIRREDPFFHAAQVVEPDESDGLWRRIRMHVCSEIAQWDFHLCEQLCELPTNVLLDPFEWLQEYGKNAGWVGLTEESDHEILRQHGLLFSIGRDEIRHSALLALNGNKDEIARKVWIAQVRVLFPIIEEQRMRLIKTLRAIDPAAIKAWEVEPEIAGDLEIGALSYRMSRTRRFKQKLTDYAFKLRKIRNKLAHLQICVPSDIPAENEWLR